MGDTCAWRTRLLAALSAPSWGPLKGAELPARRSGSFKASFKVLCRLASPEEVPPGLPSRMHICFVLFLEKCWWIYTDSGRLVWAGLGEQIFPSESVNG